MKIKITFAIIIVLVAIVLTLFCRFFGRSLSSTSSEPLSIQQIRSAIEKVGGDSVLEKEATEAIRHFREGTGSAGSEPTNCPSIDKLAALTVGEVLPISGFDEYGLPAHVLIRRGGHFNYQFIYILASGSSPAVKTSEIQFVSRSVYLRDTSR